MSDSPGSSDEEFFECTEPFPSKFYAVAVPRSSSGAGLFANITQAKSRLRSVKGSRLKAFDCIQDACSYTACPVSESFDPHLPLPEGEIVKFPSIKQTDLLRLRRYVESNDITAVKKCIADNPMYILTSYDTPTILQLVFRFNAIHIAAKSGHADVIKLIISHLESPEFWARIYPTAAAHTAEERQRRVLDLYLNSPDTGGLSSPLHLASKFGHVECVRVLANHPTTLLDSRDASGATAFDAACTRLNESLPMEEKSLRRQAITRALHECYVVLVDRSEIRDGLEEVHPTVLPYGLMGRQLHYLFSSTGQLNCPGVVEFCPHLIAHRLASPQITPPSSPMQQPLSLPFSPRHTLSPLPRAFTVAPVPSPSLLGSNGAKSGDPTDPNTVGGISGIIRVRAVLGPFDSNEVQLAVARWRRPRDAFWINLRLMDAEKGYERYGRRLAAEFNTKWIEHWAFLDDFADLRSDYGLSLLNDYLAQFYACDKKSQNPIAVMPGIFPSQKLNFDDSVDESSPKKTPHKRVKFDPNGSLVTSNTKVADALWTAYREDNNPELALSDSLEGSSSSSASSSSHENSFFTKHDGGSKSSSSMQMSPVIGMLNNFIVSSPLRLILPPSCGSPIISRPERRISMFSRGEDVTSTPQRRIPSTPMRNTHPGRQKLLTRRHVIEGVWPSLLEARTPDRNSFTTRLKASITPAELSAHNALTYDTNLDEANKSEVDLKCYPFVKTWKQELDLSMHYL